MPRHNHFILQCLLLLCLLFTCLDSRRRGQSGRTFEDSKAEERHFDFKAAPGEEAAEEVEEKPKIVLASKGDSGSTVATTVAPKVEVEEEATTQSTEDCSGTGEKIVVEENSGKMKYGFISVSMTSGSDIFCSFNTLSGPNNSLNSLN